MLISVTRDTEYGHEIYMHKHYLLTRVCRNFGACMKAFKRDIVESISVLDKAWFSSRRLLITLKVFSNLRQEAEA